MLREAITAAQPGEDVVIGVETHIASLVSEHTEGRQPGLLGEPRVNVLELNLALDARYGAVAGK